MTDSFIQVAADSTGKKVDNEALTVAGSSVYRQRVQMAGVAPTDIAVVTSSGGLQVQPTGGVLTSVGVVTSLTSATVFQGVTPWLVVASTTGGAAPVSATFTPSTSAIQLTQAATSGGNQPVFLGNTLPLSVVSSTTGGAIPVATHAVTQGTTPWQTLASTSGGNQPVSIVVGSTSSPQLVLAATSGGAQLVAQSSTPWLVVASTTGSASGIPVINVPGLGNVIGFLVQGQDRIRTKVWNIVTNYQYKLVLKFLRRGGDGWSIQTVTKIGSPGDDYSASGFASTPSISCPFGAAAGVGRTVNDCICVAGSSTISSATAAFTSGDIGKTITIAGAALAGSQGANPPNITMPTTLYQGAIASASSGTPTVAQIFPVAAVATTSGAQLKFEPILLSDDDGLELGDGILIGVDCNFWNNNATRGDCFIEVEINRGAFDMHQGITLIKGFICTSNHLGWPYGRMEYMIEGPGKVVTLQLANPAAGAEWSTSVPIHTRWQLLGIRAALATSSGASSRQVVFVIDDGVTTQIPIYSAQQQAAALSYTYNAYPGAESGFITAALGAHQVYLALSPLAFLTSGWRVRSSTANIQAVDQWSGVTLYFMRWPEN